MRAKYRFFNEDEVIAAAQRMVCDRIKEYNIKLNSPDAAYDYLKLNLAHLEHEVFGSLFLDSQVYLIADEKMSRGTIDTTSVYPREVVKMALRHNAASVILYHNHPSNNEMPSSSDLVMTERLVDALKLVQIKVIDHIIIAGNRKYSFAQHGKV